MSLDKGGQGSLDKAYTPKAVQGSYTIDGSDPAHIMTYDKTGQKVGDGSDAAAIIQAAINALPTTASGRGLGTVLLKGMSGSQLTLDVATPITLKKGTRLIGEGQQAVILNKTTDTNCLLIEATDSLATWEISNLTIQMNQKTGHAISSTYSGDGGEVGRALLNRIYIKDVKAGYKGVYLTDFRMGRISQVRVDTYGDGFYFDNDGTSGFEYGDAFLFDLQVVLQAATGTGFSLIGNASNKSMNLIAVHRLAIISGDVSGTKGLSLQTTDRSSFHDIDVEGTNIAVEILPTPGSKSKNLEFFNPRITGPGGYGFFCQYGTGLIHLYGGEIVGGAGCSYLWYDAQNDATLLNAIWGTKLTGVGAVQRGGGGYIHTLLNDVEDFVTVKKGTSTGTGGQQTIPHGCGFTPTYDQVLLSERTTGGALARQTAVPDATNIYITATNAKDYNWRVDVNR